MIPSQLCWTNLLLFAVHQRQETEDLKPWLIYERYDKKKKTICLLAHLSFFSQALRKRTFWRVVKPVLQPVVWTWPSPWPQFLITQEEKIVLKLLGCPVNDFLLLLPSQSEELAESGLHFELPIQQAKVNRLRILAQLGLHDEIHLKNRLYQL